ncbi:MAG: metalloregulator ArsR/SmtB family transcription factor [Micrococcales bacterium]|nr:metalloregulator ArsR/SmtB family transcription factor [Micrococcales bacterium]
MPVSEILPLPDLTARCSPAVREPIALEPIAPAPVAPEQIDPEQVESLAGLLKALAHPARLRLLSMVAAHDGGEACVCDLIEPLGLSQPTVSHHLKILAGAGYLTRSQRGTWAYYRLVPGSLDAVAALLSEL